MEARINPFHELYIGESIGPEKFINLFSDVIVENALALFQPGHVILKGLPGTGKSMLLNLLRSSIRIAYANNGRPYPVPSEFVKFIGAGINLKRSGINDFGQRPIEKGGNENNIYPIYFGDFLNYWLVEDVLSSLFKLSNEDDSHKLAKEIGISYSTEKIDLFANAFSKSDCWQGYMNSVNTFEEMQNRIRSRIVEYRKYLNYNTSNLPEEISQSKTIIGIPISKCVELLREYDIIEKDVEVYIRIDQYEELAWLNNSISELGTSFQEIIHKLLGMRDSNVSYRIGTRHFAWAGTKKMFGSSARLEKKRNYTEISIDSVLRRKENQRTWVFPKFAEDIFKRRINNTLYKYSDSHDSLITKVFGKGDSPMVRANNYLKSDKEKAIRIEENWPDNWKNFLKKLSQENPLSARLGEAWGRQKDKDKIMFEKVYLEPYPWDQKKWWRKERIEQALIQIASRNQQQLMWYGKDDIIALSGGNILIFLSLCQHIWDIWLRDNRNEIQLSLNLPFIDKEIQSAGIIETSNDWQADISDEKGGRERKLFLTYLGQLFNKSLVEDKAMSYPGHNGFSLKVEDIEKDELIYEFVTEACDYGDLYDAPHTSKLQDKKKRQKWYLNPILSPYYKIPYAHTKEPIYINLDTLQKWLKASEALQPSDLNKIKNNKPVSDNHGIQGEMVFPQ